MLGLLTKTSDRDQIYPPTHTPLTAKIHQVKPGKTTLSDRGGWEETEEASPAVAQLISLSEPQGSEGSPGAQKEPRRAPDCAEGDESLGRPEALQFTRQRPGEEEATQCPARGWGSVQLNPQQHMHPRDTSRPGREPPGRVSTGPAENGDSLQKPGWTTSRCR